MHTWLKPNETWYKFTEGAKQWTDCEDGGGRAETFYQTGQIDKGWHEINNGIKKVAGEFFEKDTPKRKWEDSKESETLRKELKTLKKKIKGEETEEEEGNMKEIEVTRKKLHKSKIRDKKNLRATWAEEMTDAQLRHDWKNVWVLARKIAGTNLGPKKRRYNVVVHEPATSDDWMIYFSGAGKEDKQFFWVRETLTAELVDLSWVTYADDLSRMGLVTNNNGRAAQEAAQVQADRRGKAGSSRR
jgi:hypothetical protein